MQRIPRWLPVTMMAAVLAAAYLSHADPASQQGFLPYQGTLELNGVAVSGNTPMTFILENATAELTRVALPNVAVTAGRFAVVLGPLSALTLAADPLYIRTVVDGVTLGGRQRVYPQGRAAASDFAVGDFFVPGRTTTGTLTTGPVTVTTSAGEMDVTFSRGVAAGTWEVGTGAVGAPGGANAFYMYGDNAYRMTVSNAGDVTVGRDVSVGRNAAITGTLDIGLERLECNGAAGLICACPAGKRLLGGGAYCAGNNQHVNTSWARSITEWQAWCEAPDGTNTTTIITILCARL